MTAGRRQWTGTQCCIPCILRSTQSIYALAIGGSRYTESPPLMDMQRRATAMHTERGSAAARVKTILAGVRSARSCDEQHPAVLCHIGQRCGPTQALSKSLHAPIIPHPHMARLTLVRDGKSNAVCQLPALLQATSLQLVTGRPATGQQKEKVKKLSLTAPSVYGTLHPPPRHGPTESPLYSTLWRSRGIDNPDPAPQTAPCAFQQLSSQLGTSALLRRSVKRLACGRGACVSLACKAIPHLCTDAHSYPCICVALDKRVNFARSATSALNRACRRRGSLGGARWGESVGMRSIFLGTYSCCWAWSVHSIPPHSS